jgi:soluble lytic murein transglycosylase-like protein
VLFRSLYPDRLVLMPLFDSAAREFGVPANLLKAVAWQESGWQNHKVSPVNARGIGQLTPATVAFINDRLLRARLDPGRADHNVRMSARYLAYLLAHGKGDAGFALSAYYQGLGSLRREGPKPHTHAYVAAVLALSRRF